MRYRSGHDDARRQNEIRRVGDVRPLFEIDRARIIHSSAFRRLQGKTQVFGVAEGDFFRTRLTHSMEASQIGKGITLMLNSQLPPEWHLSAELVEAACLAHDLGHPPFGHNGEQALQRRMAPYGGFESNAQNLRILNHLETKVPGYGLNLTRATLDALLKYRRSYSDVKQAQSMGQIVPEKYFYDFDTPIVDWIRDGRSRDYPVIECQVMEWADDVAYSVHDLEDGLHSGVVTLERLHDDDIIVPIAKRAGVSPEDVVRVLSDVRERLYGRSLGARKQKRKELTAYLINRFVTSCQTREVEANGERFLQLEIPSDVRCEVKVLKAVEMELIITGARVGMWEFKSISIVERLFEAFAQPEVRKLYPQDFRPLFDQVRDDDAMRMRLACDYIAGMTDSYALKTYARLYDPQSNVVYDLL